MGRGGTFNGGKLLNNDVKQFVAFKVGDQEYGADIHKVSIIEKTLNYARVPTAPIILKGLSISGAR